MLPVIKQAKGYLAFVRSGRSYTGEIVFIIPLQKYNFSGVMGVIGGKNAFIHHKFLCYSSVTTMYE